MTERSPYIPEEPSRLRYWQAIRRHAWLVAFIVLLALGVAAIITAMQERVYRATTSLIIVQPGTREFRPEVADIGLTQTVAGLLETDVVAEAVIDELGLDTTPEKLVKKLAVTVRPSSSVLDVTFDANSREQATEVLSTFSSIFTARVEKDLVAAGVTVNPAGTVATPITANLIDVKTFSPPRVQPEPVAPKPARTLAFAGILSLIIGLLVAFLRERFDDRIRDREDARRSLGAPVVGALPDGWKGPPRALVGRQNAPRPATRGGWRGMLSPRGKGATVQRQQVDEAMQLLSLNVEAMRTGSSAAIVVTSTWQEEGKSTVVANLGVSMARGGLRVICVEVDGREPALHRFLNVEPASYGLVHVAKGQADLQEALVTVPVAGVLQGGRDNGSRGNLRVLTMGEPGVSLAAMLDDGEIEYLIETLRAEADFVIFDASPLSRGEAHRLVRGSDVVLLVARRGWTRRARAEAARTILERLGVRRVAVVLTDADAGETLV